MRKNKTALLSLVFLFIATCALAANKWSDGSATFFAGTTLINDIDTEMQDHVIEPLDRFLANGRHEMAISYSSASALSVGSGSIVCSNSGGTLYEIRRNTASTSVTFADIDTGAEGASTTYYVYASCDADATTATFKISASSSAPTGLTLYRRLGSFYNNSSSNIEAYSITNDSFPNLVGVNNSIVYLNYNTNLRGNTISNGYLGKTTTGTTIFNNGTDVAVPTGCYVIGGIKQSDANFTYFNYACP